MPRKTKRNTVIFQDEVLELSFHKYGNGRPAIELICDDGGPYATATVNMVDAMPAKDCVFIKDYSENEGMLDSLVKAGVVEPTGVMVRAGFVRVPEARLLPPYAAMARKAA